NALVERAIASADAMLPRAGRPPNVPAVCPPRERDGAFEFDNGSLRARVTSGGEIVELSADGIPSAIERGNRLALYRDRPAKWEAWNVDADYVRFPEPLRMRTPRIADGGLAIPFDAGTDSRGTLRLSIAEGEPFLRVDAAIDWRSRRRLLRVENDLRVDAGEVTYGAPHGVVVRSAAADSPARRAQYEVPGQRFAAAWDRSTGNGVVSFALDTYGWNGRAPEPGRLRLGHSLLRGTTWPDPHADAGEHQLAWAYAPVRAGGGIGSLERDWLRFACEPSVRLFETGDDAVLIAACKPAEDGDGVVLRVRECDGAARRLRIRCGGRMREVRAVDALERPLAGDAAIEAESIAASIGAFALRSFRVRF
ncbi:MAG TPA: glycoside hydrolase family 38 C-terminal domain-containing protein, partial [Candidatus Tumulicola sp.]|nr:glycoside hydrolase family 38 C-terminal domain-containing protein [Candidatus Tumulicola sp.]